MFVGWLLWVLDWNSPNYGFMVHNNSESSLVVEVKSKQHHDPSLMELKELKPGTLNELFSLEGVLKYQGRLCVTNVDEFRNQILEEDHSFRYSIHPSSTEMYHDLREVFCWMA